MQGKTLGNSLRAWSGCKLRFYFLRQVYKLFVQDVAIKLHLAMFDIKTATTQATNVNKQHTVLNFPASFFQPLPTQKQNLSTLAAPSESSIAWSAGYKVSSSMEQLVLSQDVVLANLNIPIECQTATKIVFKVGLSRFRKFLPN